MKNRKSVFCLVLALILMLSALCGCGASNEAADIVVSPSAPAAGMADSSSKGESFYGYVNDMAVEAPEAPAAPAPAPDAPMEEQSSVYVPQSIHPNGNLKLIHRANMDMETTEFDSAVAALDKLVSEMGGYFESSSLDNYSAYRYAYYTIRVPAETFSNFCLQAGQLCQLNNISRSTEDVSEAYYDTESRLATQKTKLERLQELLAQAENMEDIITLESAISETELAIESLTGSLRKYDSLVGYSTIYLSLSEVYQLTEVEEPVVGFGAKLVQAFKTGAIRFGNSLQNMLLNLARNWVSWLIFLVIAAVVLILVLRVVKRRRKALAQERLRWEARQQENEKK